METITLRDYLQGVPKAERAKVLAVHLAAYEVKLQAAHVPLWFVRAIGFGIRREALMNRPVEYTRQNGCVVLYGDMDEDKIVRRYENSIQ